MRYLVGLLAFGCTVDVEDAIIDIDEVPDIAGEYTATVSSESGCDGIVDGSWLDGDLLVDGTGDTLVWTFADGTVVDGAIDTTYTWTFAGDWTESELSGSLSGEGLAYIESADEWVLDGDLALTIADGVNDCVLAVNFQAL